MPMSAGIPAGFWAAIPCSGQLRGDATQQGRERRTKARCPLFSSKLGCTRHLRLSLLMLVLRFWQELEGFHHLAKHKATRTGASRRKEDAQVRSIPACPTLQ